MTGAEHTPVMPAEALQGLKVRQGGSYLDCTGGLGGHARMIKEVLSGTGRLVIAERHGESSARLKEMFAACGNVTVALARFSQIFDKVTGEFDGILADLGVSSAQLDDARLGLAFAHAMAPLDMRLDGLGTETAADMLKCLTREELADLFYHHGGERYARKIAAAIVADRERGASFATTADLRGLCERVLGKYYRGAKIHPATKVFQALRIAVNDESGELEALLNLAPQRLGPGGRMVVIAFHEGEDAPVKKKFRELAQSGEFTLPVRKAIKPADTEVRANPRARSARMRVLARKIV